MANDGMIEFLTPDALAQLKEASAIVDKLVPQIEKINNFKAPKSPSGADNTAKQMTADLKDQEQALKKLSDIQLQIERNAKNQNKSNQNLTKSQLEYTQAIERGLKAKEREVLANQRLNDAYGKLNASRNQAARTLQNLIASETASNAEIRKAQREFDILDGKVKKADKAVGNFSRNVGNYGSALSGATQLMGAFGIATGVYLAADLVKNIFQTTKELQSLDLALKMVSETQDRYAANTSFVRELSEKWGIEIKGLTEQFTQFYVNAKGKLSEDAIKKSFEGIAKAGALMGISIDKQNDAFYAFNQMLSKGTVQAEELKKQLGNALPGAIKAATMAYQELNPNLKVTEQMMLDQMKAGKLVSTEMVPAIIRAYQKLYGIENVNGVDTLAAAQNRLTNSWTAMVKAMNEGSTSGVSKFFNIILTGLTNILTLTSMLFKDEKQLQQYFQSVGAGKASEELDSYREKFKTFSEETRKFMDSEYAETQRQNIKMQLQVIKEQQALRKTILGGDRAAFHLQTKIEEDALVSLGKSRAILNLLKKQAEPVSPVTSSGSGAGGDGETKIKKAKKDKIALTFKEIESEYNLKIAILERKKAENADDDQTSYEERIAKRIAFSEASIEIIDMQLQKEAALIKFKRDEDYAKNDLALKNKEISLEQHSINQTDIINTYINKTLTAEIKASDDIKALQKQDLNFFKSIKYKQQDEVLKLNKLITTGEIAKYKIIADNENKTLVVREAAFQAYIQLEKDLLEAQKISDIERAKSRGASKEEIAAITAEYENAIAALGNIKSPKMLAIEEVNAEMKQIAQSFAGDAGFGATFKLLSEGLDKYGDNVAAKTVVIMEAFQEMFNFINQMSQENFEAEKQRLEEQTKIALAFAGESDTARAEIERQAEQRRKEIAAREFKAKKEQAIFNIAIDTAQAIISIWAQVPKVDFGISAGLLSAFVGALGLAQIAMVSSQQVPAYKKGTDNHIGGAMLVNDGSGSNYKETIQTPDGKIYQPKERNVIMNAPKGTKVFTHDQWQRNLDNILMKNEINYAQPNVVVNSGMSDEQVDRIVNTIANKQEAILSIDKNGWNTSVRNGHTQKEILNNQVTFGR